MRPSLLWEKLIWAVMFLVVYEGALRKWVAPSLHAQIYFLKDFVLVCAYICFLASRKPPSPHLRVMEPARVVLILSFIYFTLQLLNPNSPSFLVSISGLKNYLLYAPMIFVVPYMFTSSQDLEHKLRLYAMLMFPCVALGIVQFAFPPTHWINGYLNHQDSENLRMGAVFGGTYVNVRSIGTFSYIGGYTAFLTVMFYLGAGLAAKSRWRISGNLWIFAFLITTVAAMYTTGSRGPIWGLLLTLPLLLFLWGYSGVLSWDNAGRLILAAAIVWVAAQFLAADAFEAYSYRVEQASDTLARLLSPFTEAFGALQVSGPIGTGMASASGGALTIMGTLEFWWLNGNVFELETARVLQETGIVGFILVYSVRVWLLVKAASLSLRFRNPLYIGLSAGIAGLFVQNLIGFVVNNATVGIYHWFAAGLLFGMYRLEKVEARGTQDQFERAYGRVAKYSKVRA